MQRNHFVSVHPYAIVKGKGGDSVQGSRGYSVQLLQEGGDSGRGYIQFNCYRREGIQAGGIFSSIATGGRGFRRGGGDSVQLLQMPGLFN